MATNCPLLAYLRLLRALYRALPDKIDASRILDRCDFCEIFVPASVEEEMREVDQATNGSSRAITLDQLNAIAASHGTRHQELEQALTSR